MGISATALSKYISNICSLYHPFTAALKVLCPDVIRVVFCIYRSCWSVDPRFLYFWLMSTAHCCTEILTLHISVEGSDSSTKTYVADSVCYLWRWGLLDGCRRKALPEIQISGRTDPTACWWGDIITFKPPADKWPQGIGLSKQLKWGDSQTSEVTKGGLSTWVLSVYGQYVLTGYLRWPEVTHGTKVSVKMHLSPYPVNVTGHPESELHHGTRVNRDEATWPIYKGMH